MLDKWTILSLFGLNIVSQKILINCLFWLQFGLKLVGQKILDKWPILDSIETKTCMPKKNL